LVAKNIDREEGRGILLYINNIFGASEVEMDTTFEENLFVKIKLNNNDKLLIGIIYRSPSNKNMKHHNQLRS
jgi:ribosome biogenesis protein Nip4